MAESRLASECSKGFAVHHWVTSESFGRDGGAGSKFSFQKHLLEASMGLAHGKQEGKGVGPALLTEYLPSDSSIVTHCTALYKPWEARNGVLGFQ